MHFTPVIPEPPTPEGRSPAGVQPPVLPTFSPESAPRLPDWIRSPQAGPNFAAAFPTSTPYGGGGQMQYLGVPGAMPGMPPGMPPGSYFMPNVALPAGAMHPGMAAASPSMPPLRADGYSTDWTGYPVFGNASPHSAPGSVPASAHGTPWAVPGAMPGATPAMHPMAGFQAAHQMGFPPYAAGWGAPPAAYATPYAPAGAFPGAGGGFPGAGGGFPGAGWAGATPFQAAGVPPGFGAPPAAAGVAAAATGGAQGTHRPSRGSADGLDKFDKWTEDPSCATFVLYRVTQIC